MPTPKTTTISGHSGHITLSSNGTLIVQSSGVISATYALAVDAPSGFALITNSGTIEATGRSADAISASSGGTIINFGSIIANTSSAITSTGSIGQITNSGTITGYVGIYSESAVGNIDNEASGSIFGSYSAILIEGTANVTNAGTISARTISTVLLEGSQSVLTNSGTISGDDTVVSLEGANSVLTNSGTIDADKADYDAIDISAAGGTLVIDSGSVLIGSVADYAAGGVLELGGSTANALTFSSSQYTGFPTITFDDANATLIGSAADLSSTQETITGFARGDTVDVTGFSETSFSVSGSLLTLKDGSTTATLAIESTLPLSDLAVTSANGTTTIALCYLCGTRVLTPTGEAPIETLAIGQPVVTRFGGIRPIKWIGRQNYAAAFVANNPEKHPVHIRAGALGPNTPARDLFVSPGHSVLLGETLILAKSLINGITITQSPPEADIAYYQIELDTHDCIIAEGAFSETYADGPGLRGQFHNVAEYFQLYPNAAEPPELILCAPRPERGPDLARALLPIIDRAAHNLQPGPLIGAIDRISPTGEIDGWAFDTYHPDMPVKLECLIGNTVIGTILACDPREDLRLAGLALGQCAFFAKLAEPLAEGAISALRIRRASDGAELAPTATCRRALAA
jgi:hypothetical protein